MAGTLRGVSPIDGSVVAERRVLSMTAARTAENLASDYPYMTAVDTVAPAPVAGDAVILRHAARTPLVDERMAHAVHSAGLPEDVFASVSLDQDTTSGLIAERAFDFVDITGSVEGGWAMERAAAGAFVPVATELAGKDPGDVMDDADLDAAVDTRMDGATFNAGRCRCGIERICVHASLSDTFVEEVVAPAEVFRHGDTFHRETTLGPVANVRFAAHVRPRAAADVERAARIRDRLRTGTVSRNRADYRDPAPCRTGREGKDSGAGMSTLGFHAATRPKSYRPKGMT